LSIAWPWLTLALLNSVSTFADEKKEATDATQKALRAEFQVDSKIKDTANYVSNYLPFRDELLVMGAGYKIYQKQEIQLKLDAEKRLTLTPNSAKISITF
jgi:hypothetical protein